MKVPADINYYKLAINFFTVGLLTVAATAIFIGLRFSDSTIAESIYSLGHVLSELELDVMGNFAHTSLEDLDEVTVFPIISTMVVFIGGVLGGFCIDASGWGRMFWLSLFLLLYIGVLNYITGILSGEWELSRRCSDNICYLDWVTWVRLVNWVVGSPASLVLGAILGIWLAGKLKRISPNRFA